MRRVLVTCRSGTGRSSALAALEGLGFHVVDTDEPGWTEWSDQEDGYVWLEEPISGLLARDDGPSLYVSGTGGRRRRCMSERSPSAYPGRPGEAEPAPRDELSSARGKQDRPPYLWSLVPADRVAAALACSRAPGGDPERQCPSRPTAAVCSSRVSTASARSCAWSPCVGTVDGDQPGVVAWARRSTSRVARASVSCSREVMSSFW